MSLFPTVLAKIKSGFSSKTPVYEKEAAPAYDLWAHSYDDQPGNLMLYLDEQLVKQLLNGICLQGKIIVDFGCGTGRHWPMLYATEPSTVIGYDVSAGMLKQLQRKFPASIIHLNTDNLLLDLGTATVDILLSTLTIAHIENIEELINSWSRVLKPGCDLIITDYHPQLLTSGGKRDFNSKGIKITIQNFIHPIEDIIYLASKNNLQVVTFEERIINDGVTLIGDQLTFFNIS